MRSGHAVTFLAAHANVAHACGTCGSTLALQAATDGDRAFLQALFIATRFDEFMQSGWEAERIHALLAEQFEAQDRYYRQHYPAGHFDIVTLDGAPIGRLYHAWTDAELRLIDIALLPERRGAGLGRRLLHALLAETARRGLAARLYVETGNPVRALYLRLGFVRAGENGVYDLMRREAAPFDSAMLQITLAELEAGKAGRRASGGLAGTQSDVDACNSNNDDNRRFS